MRKKVIVRAPVLTRSGYGEHARFVLRSLREREDMFDIFIIPINWGETGWISENTEEREWLDERIKQTTIYAQQGGRCDISIQVTIPNEWEKMAPVNIGVTAGIETTRVSHQWIEKANIMDRVITISEHSKESLVNTVYHGQNPQTGQPVTLKCEVPVEIVHYPIKKFDKMPDLNLDFDYDFNYLLVAQAGPRKNLDNTIRWFIEENFDQEVGLVVKTFVKNGSLVDRGHTEKMLKDISSAYPERKCKIYLIHGDMKDEEIHSLYVHPKIKCLISLSHGEGFGLPMFEAAYSGLPVLTTGWSGQCDFLYAPPQSPKKKGKKKRHKQPYFAEIEYTLGPIQESTIWEGVLIRESQWAYPKEGSYKMKLRQVRKNYNTWKKKADTLQKWIHENFKEEDMKKKFVNFIYKEEEFDIESWLGDLNVEVNE